MALVKSQLNPHFLFNTLNNIDVLIEKDAAKASEYLNKLSDIMRFMLYETKTEQISLQKEWAYIEKYIELQKIRTTSTDFAVYSLQGELAATQIAPMTLIPFIENAFKHAEGIKENNTISIHIQVKNNTLFFECKNRYLQNTAINTDIGGLGNNIVIKRLELLYPSRHLLQITDNEGLYTVQLSINLP
jgi:LytS/YehU family sensor histidine kinase